MAKKGIRFVCQSCGNEFAKWMGKCPACNEWNTLVEETTLTNHKVHNKSWAASLGSGRQPQSITEVSSQENTRISTGIPELDRVLGGGLVLGSLGLVGGDPGIGKSTLLLQVAAQVAKTEGPVLYVSGEESLQQLKLRASRLAALTDQLRVVTEANVSAIAKHISDLNPVLVIIDSIQTTFVEELSSPPGSVAQVREGAARFLQIAKSSDTPLLLVGHVTKGGAIAGPKVLEHAVDFVLYFEGDSRTTFRILRGVKNRFGSTNEVGIFDMQEQGLVEVTNPSELFLEQRPQGSPGSVVVPFMEGTRPLLVEIQALVGSTFYGGTPRRQTTGVDYQRFSIILAVLEKRQGYPLQNQDVYVNAAGGLRVDEPAADLGMAVAVASSVTNLGVNPQVAVMGEIGLAGELRAVSHADVRLKELHKLGFTHCIVPQANYSGKEPIKCWPAATVKEALERLNLIARG